MHLQRGWSVVLLGVALTAAGCGSGPGTIAVEGIVTLDGKPLEKAAVSFKLKEGRPATGETDANGKFKLTTFKPGDGALPGRHKVSVSKLAAAGPAGPEKVKTAADPNVRLSGPPMSKTGDAPPQSLVPVKYVNPDTSGIEVEVKSGMTLPVEIKLVTSPQ